MIDIYATKTRADLVALAGVDLKRVSVSKHGIELAGPCPFCGGNDRFHVQPSKHRWLCRGCTGGKWQDAIDFVIRRDSCDFVTACNTLDSTQPARAITPSPTAPKEKPAPPSWLAMAGETAERAHRAPGSWEAWQNYKPVDRHDFERCKLGVGVLPMSKCHHRRLIVPIFDGTMCVGLRGRAFECNCAKWLAPAGTDISLYPLYNADALRVGAVAIICENPIDALMVDCLSKDYCGVATYSVVYWQDKWLQPLRQAQLIIVAYDNDLAGNGGGKQHARLIAEWRAKMLAKNPNFTGQPPEPRGIALVNMLLAEKLPAVLMEWGDAPHKYDLGAMIKDSMR